MLTMPNLENSNDDLAATTRSDEQWMVDFHDDNTAAFTILFSRYKQPLFGFFRRRVLDPACAEELTQETFLVLLRNASAYRPDALFRTYLYSIAFNILRTHRRKSAFRATFLGVAADHHE